jgi:hypothetical protein
MAILLFANNIQTTLATSITSTQTSVTLVSTAGLPDPTAGQYFIMTFTNGTTNEVVWVTDVTGSSITVIRGQEGTSQSSFPSGSYASCFPTAGTMQDLIQIDQLQNGSYTFANGAGSANALTATISSNLSSLPNGFQFILNAANANTGSATLNLTLNPTISGQLPISTGALPIYQNGTFLLSGGEITGANYLCLMTYNANYNGGLGGFVLENPYNPVTGVVGITQIQDQYFTYSPGGGTSDTLTLAVPAGLGALVDGATVTFRNTVSANATTTPTLNVTYGSTTTGATPIKKYNNQPLSAGDTGGVGYVLNLVYSSYSGAWMLLNPAPGVAGGVTSVSAGTGISVSSPSGAVTISNTGVTSVNASTGAVTVTPASIGAGSLSGTNSWTGSNTFGGSFNVTSGVASFTNGITASSVSVSNGSYTTNMNYQQIQVGGTNTAIINSGSSLQFEYAGGVFMYGDSAGNIYVSTQGYKPGGGSWGSTSDQRLKNSATPLTGALDLITSLNPVSYDWNYSNNEPKVGFIAQEIQKVLPNAVSTTSPNQDQKPFIKDGKVLNLGFQNDIYAYLVGAIKELNQKVAVLENTVNIQASYITALQAKV